MKVYIVKKCEEWEPSIILAVFADKQVAEEYVRNREAEDKSNDEDYYFYIIQEEEVK